MRRVLCDNTDLIWIIYSKSKTTKYNCIKAMINFCLGVSPQKTPYSFVVKYLQSFTLLLLGLPNLFSGKMYVQVQILFEYLILPIFQFLTVSTFRDQYTLLGSPLLNFILPKWRWRSSWKTQKSLTQLYNTSSITHIYNSRIAFLPTH